jgi:hypothetical protein
MVILLPIIWSYFITVHSVHCNLEVN